jgi:MFS transporter, DHA1 family, multidrug resistance protein
MVGVLMAVYPVAFLFTAPLVGNYMQKVGRKNMVLLGVILMSLATLMFGLGSLGSTEKVFFIVSFIARLLQGTGDAAIGVSISSIIAIEFPENLEQYMGYLNMSLGAGLCLGPLMGSVVFRYFNYLDTFYLFTAYIFIIGIASVSIIPKRVNTVVQ